MKINKSIFIVIIAMIFLVMASVNAQDGADNDSVDLAFDGNVSLSASDNSIYVDDLSGDDRNDGKSWDSSVKTINQALNLSSDGATIHLSSGNYNSTGNVRINITKSVNIIGSENTTFDGLGKDYLFVVNDNLTVTFKNINFVNALKNQNSYPLHDSEGEWNLNNRYGAALEIKNSTVTIDNCQFSNNKLSNGLKKYAIYGAAVSSFGDLTILNSYFSNNLIDSMAPSRYGYGGAVFNRGKLYVNNSSFVNSKGGKTGTYGAAIANYGFAKMENSIIDNSTALTQSYGSAIYNKGTFILSNSIIKNNRIGYGDGGYKYYGAVYNLGDFTGIGSIFENNTFTRSSSLQSAWYTANIYNEGTLNLTYNAFINNQMYSDSSDVSTSNFRRDVYNNGDVTSLNNNWWGSNENPNAMRFTNVEGVSTWLTFTLNPDYSALDIGGKITIQAELKPNEGSAKLDSFPVFSTTFKTSSVNSTKKLVNGKAKFVFDDTKNKGAYEVIAELTGFEQKIFIDVGKLKSNIEFNVTKDLTYQDIFQINVTVKGNGAKNPTGHVLMSLNGVEYTINLKNGAGTYKIDRLSKGEYSLKLTYMGDDDYAKSFTNGTVKVKRLPVDLSIDIPNVKVGQLVENGQIILNTSDAQGTYKLYIDGVYKASGRIYPGNTPIKNLGQYPEGKHEVILVYEGSDNFEPVNLTTSFEVSRYSTILNVYANNINAGEDAVITIEAIPETLRGDAELYINDVKQLIFLEDTFTNVTIYNLEPGRYDVSVVYLGDNQYYSSNDTTSFRVVKQTSNLTVNITQKENEYTGKIVVKTIPSKCTGLIGVYVNFREYKLNLTKGVARFNVEFDRGTNYIFVYYEGDDYYEGCEWNTTVGIVDTYEIIGSNVTAYEHNDFNYSIRLVEDSGVPIQYETVSVNVDGKLYNVTTNKLGFGYLTLNLAKGTYNVVSTYREESITNTFTINEIKFNLTTEDFDYGGSGIIKAQFNDDVEGSVRFYIKDVVDEIVPIANGIALINISGVNASTYKVYVNYKNDVYSSARISKTFKVNKLDLDFTYSFNQHDYVLSVSGLDNATGSLSIQIDSKKYNSAINNSKTELQLKTLSKGNHSLVITYKGDRNYNAFTLNSYIFVKELTTDITLKIKNGVYGNDLTVTANINKNASGVIRFDVEDLSKEVTVKNGVAKWVFGGIDAGTHNITATYLGDDYYIDVSNSTTFKVSKSSSKIVLYVKDVYLDENIIIYTNLSTNATGKVLYSMDNYYSPRYKPTTDSKSVWYISPLDTGSYTIRATFEGDNNYYESSTVFILNISQKRAILDVEIEDVNVKDRVVSNFKLTNSKGVGLSGKVKLELNSRTYDIDIKKGESSLVIGKLPAGNYSYTVTYAGNSVYGKTSYKGSFEVRDTRLNTTIYAYNLTKYYKNDKKLSIYLVSSKNKVISGATMDVTIAGKTYTVVTNNEGLATLDVNLATGSYIASINFEGDDDYFASSANATVTILSTVEGIDVVKVYGTSTQYYAVFSDSNGKPLANKQVKFTIGSNSYKATTLPNGIVRLNINLKAGTYTITAINQVTSQKYTNKIVIKNRLMENKNIQKYYGGTKKYQVRAYGDNGKVAVGVKVKMKLNGKTYTVKTDKKGYASLSVNLKPGTYTVKATYKGYSVSNKITVKSTIVTKNLSKKKSKTASFQAKLLNSNGKILKGKKITFKFKGKKYTAKTNSKGIATFKVKNNLKVGKYKIYTTYGKLTRTNTITVKK